MLAPAPWLKDAIDAVFAWLAGSAAYVALELKEFRGVDGRFPAYDADKGAFTGSQLPAIVFEPVEYGLVVEAPGFARPRFVGSLSLVYGTSDAARGLDGLDAAIATVLARLMSRSAAQSFGSPKIHGFKVEGEGKIVPSLGDAKTGLVRAWIWSVSIGLQGPRVSTA